MFHNLTFNCSSSQALINNIDPAESTNKVSWSKHIESNIGVY